MKKRSTEEFNHLVGRLQSAAFFVDRIARVVEELDAEVSDAVAQLTMGLQANEKSCQECTPPRHVDAVKNV